MRIYAGRKASKNWWLEVSERQKNSISFSIKRERDTDLTHFINRIYCERIQKHIDWNYEKIFALYDVIMFLRGLKKRFQCPIKKEKYLNYGNDVRRESCVVMLELMISFSWGAKKTSVKHAKMYIFMGRHLTPFSDGFITKNFMMPSEWEW